MPLRVNSQLLTFADVAQFFADDNLPNSDETVGGFRRVFASGVERPAYERPGTKEVAYVIGEEGVNIIALLKLPKVLVPLYQAPNEAVVLEHMRCLVEAVQHDVSYLTKRVRRADLAGHFARHFEGQDGEINMIGGVSRTIVGYPNREAAEARHAGDTAWMEDQQTVFGILNQVGVRVRSGTQTGLAVFSSRVCVVTAVDNHR